MMWISIIGNTNDVLILWGTSYHVRSRMTPLLNDANCSYKGCEFLSWVTNQIYSKIWGFSYHTIGIMITAFYYTNCSYNGCELLSWVTNIVIIQQGSFYHGHGHTIKTPCLLPMMEIHTPYMSTLFNSTGGHSTMAVVRRPPHYRDIMLLPMIQICILYMRNWYNSTGVILLWAW